MKTLMVQPSCILDNPTSSIMNLPATLKFRRCTYATKLMAKSRARTTQRAFVGRARSGSDEFSYVGNGLPFNIDAGLSQAITIRFTPTSEGSKSAIFNANSNDPDEPDVTFNVSGNGVATQITGTTGEVNCDILGETTVELYQGDVLKGSTTSDIDGNYALPVPETGDYDVVDSKTGFKDQTQPISIPAGGIYTLDFMGETGLVPNAPNLSYVLACVHIWLYPDPPCELSLSKVLAVVHAWLYPQ